ncbi:MAG: hypothetical protein M0R03_05005, partial [Novosphingobium sp.]|nr:hypothetical protein [Novosphingobium sp.]
AMQDSFSNHSPGLEAPGSSLFAITPADSDLPALVRALKRDGRAVVLGEQHQVAAGPDIEGVPSGSFIPVRTRRVMAATTASSIVGIV